MKRIFLVILFAVSCQNNSELNNNSDIKRIAASPADLKPAVPIIKQYSRPLFLQDKPRVEDVIQPNLSVCFIYAFFSGLALMQPELIINQIERTNDGFLVKVFNPQEEKILVKDAWLDTIVEFTKPKNRGIWPEVLASAILYDFAKNRSPENIDKGFLQIIKQIKEKEMVNVTIMDAIEQLGDKKTFIQGKKTLNQNGEVLSQKLMFDFWKFFTDIPGMTYKMPWDSDIHAPGQKILPQFLSDQTAFDFIKNKLAKKSVMIGYINNYAKVVPVLDDYPGKVSWRKEDPEVEKEGVQTSGYYTDHSYAILNAFTDELGKIWVTILNPHERKLNLGPKYAYSTAHTIKNYKGTYDIPMSDFRRIFYTLSTN